MFFKGKESSNTYAYALGGAAIAGTIVPVPVVVNRRINDAWDERLGNGLEEAPRPQKAGLARVALCKMLGLSRAC